MKESFHTLKRFLPPQAIESRPARTESLGQIELFHVVIDVGLQGRIVGMEFAELLFPLVSLQPADDILYGYRYGNQVLEK
jgi:hypothetical protein